VQAGLKVKAPFFAEILVHVKEGVVRPSDIRKGLRGIQLSPWKGECFAEKPARGRGGGILFGGAQEKSKRNHVT